MVSKLIAVRPIAQAMPARRRHVGRRAAVRCAAAAALVLAHGANVCAADEVSAFSAWVASDNAAVRLVDAGPAPGELLAGVELRLDPGFLTYWRTPGDAGLPPTFDFSMSTNLAAAAVDYPAPGRFDEAGSDAYGYRDNVLFPLHVTRKDPRRPVTLVLDLGYAVCATLCLPGKAHVSLTLSERTDPDAAALVAAALARVPRPASLAGPGPLAIDKVERRVEDGKTGLVVTARAPVSAELFVEAPEGWYLQPARAVPADRGRVTFAVAALDSPAGGELAAVDLRFTLVDPAGAITVIARAGTAP